MRSSVYSLLIAILTVNMCNAQGGGSVYCGKLTENFNACNANGATAPRPRAEIPNEVLQDHPSSLHATFQDSRPECRRL